MNSILDGGWEIVMQLFLVMKKEAVPIGAMQYSVTWNPNGVELQLIVTYKPGEAR